MIKYVYLRHHTQYEDEYDDDELAMVLGLIIHNLWEGLSAFESLTLTDGMVLTTIEQVEQLQAKLEGSDTQQVSSVQMRQATPEFEVNITPLKDGYTFTMHRKESTT